MGQQYRLYGFDNLVNKTWKADGVWSNGTKFKQEVSFNYDLNKTLVIVNSKGFINKEQTAYGNRSHGVRQFNAKQNNIQFWEFDVFGDVTQGKVSFKDKDIYYHYHYGDTMVTDCWEYINDNTYKFTVGSYKNDKWESIYLQTEFKVIYK